MPSKIGLRLLRRLLGAPTQVSGPHAGHPVCLDGHGAVARTEALIAEAAGLGGGALAQPTELAWRMEQQGVGRNAQGAPLTSQRAEGPHGALAVAVGMALSGMRATSFLDASELGDPGDLLAVPGGRRLPLVLHLIGDAAGAQGPMPGPGEAAAWSAAESGCLILVAANCQEAVDFSLIARRAAEAALAPALVAMDGARIGAGIQEVRLPSATLVTELLGPPDQEIRTQDEADRLLFGERRRRVPRWHDHDHPVLLGARTPAEAAGPGRAAARAFFDRGIHGALESAYQEFGRLTGRVHRSVSEHRVADARLVLVAIGAAVETAELAADLVRKAHHTRVGVLGLRCLHPFPGPQLLERLGGGVRVLVLESVDQPMDQDPPLLRALRGALDRAAENRRFGGQTHPGLAPVSERDRPRLVSVIHGLGGAPLRVADLVRLCLDAEGLSAPRTYLGIDFSPALSKFPKRQVLLDRLRRAYPEVAGLGLAQRGGRPGPRLAGALTLLIHRWGGQPGEALAAEACALLQRVHSGGLRARLAPPSTSFGGHCTDRVTSSEQPLKDPGDTPPADLTLMMMDCCPAGIRPDLDLVQGADLLVLTDLPVEAIWARLPTPTRARVKAGDLRLHLVAAPGLTGETFTDTLLGALFGVLIERGLIPVTQRRLLALREEVLLRETHGVEAHLDAFAAGLGAPRLVAHGALPLSTADSNEDGTDTAPAQVRRIGEGRGGYDSLPGFWDRVGVLYRTEDLDELSPEPYLATGTLPPLSAGFRDLSPLRRQLPVFDAGLCTGCGACWSSCPDGAIAAATPSAAGLVDAGIRAAGAAALRPIAAKLAAGVADLCANPLTVLDNTGELLTASYERIASKMPFPEKRKAAIDGAMAALVAAIGHQPLAATDALFRAPETQAKGRGRLLALALNPNTCKGCGICAHQCEPGAIALQPQGREGLDQARKIHRAWDLLSESGPSHADSQLDPLAGAMIGPGTLRAMTGGDGIEPGSGARLALRQVVSLLEARQAPLVAAFRDQVEQAREQIANLIRATLADALPADDLDGLAARLHDLGARHADLSSVLGDARDAIDNAVDAARLRRLVDLARELGALGWRLADGGHGLGRARLGLVLSPGASADWAGAFPDNPFAQPVTLDCTGDGGALALGLLEGQLRQAVEGFALMRKARLELDRPADAARSWSDLDALTWRDLVEPERALCPPLLLVGDGASLGGRGLAQLQGLLGSDLPIRILILADLDLGLGGPPGLGLPLSPTQDPGSDLALLAIAQRGAYVAQSSIAAPDHLAASLAGACAHWGPALVQVQAPSPTRDGFPSDRTLERARMATEARVLPLFRYDPRAAGVFGARITLEGNPEPAQIWLDGGDGSGLTPAHWALGEARFAERFSPLPEDAPAPTPLSDYLDLSPAEQARATPYIERAANGSEAQRLAVDPCLCRACAQRQDAWRTLQELAGLVTPFTERVYREGPGAGRCRP